MIPALTVRRYFFLFNLLRDDRNCLAQFADHMEFHASRFERKQCIIAAAADVVARMEFCSPLTNENFSRAH